MLPGQLPVECSCDYCLVLFVMKSRLCDQRSHQNFSPAASCNRPARPIPLAFHPGSTIAVASSFKFPGHPCEMLSYHPSHTSISHHNPVSDAHTRNGRRDMRRLENPLSQTPCPTPLTLPHARTLSPTHPLPCVPPVPVAHKTGGLRDTVIDFDPFTQPPVGTGWTFENFESGGLMHATGLALSTLRKHPEDFEGLQRRGMERDSSWNGAAKTYEQVFEWMHIDPPYCR